LGGIMNSTSAVLARLFACAIAVLWAGAAFAQTVTDDFSKGQPNGAYKFASWTPDSLPQLLKGNAANERTEIVGHLFLPKGNEKVPAVILMHGSGGIYRAMLEYWPRQFNAAGIAVLSIDSFGPRGVKSTAEDQSQVPFAADVTDAFAALKLLASHPRVDAKRIAIMGFSRGGITTWRAGVERIIAAQKLTDGLRFAAHIPVYSGGCTGIFRLQIKPDVFSKAPMLWIHGDADDYTAIGPCQEYADKIGKAGTPVEFVVIKGARHKFDADDLKRTQISGAQVAIPTCPIEIDIETMAAYDRTTGERLQGEAFKSAQKKCVGRGASVEGNAAARDQAGKAAVGFLRKVFGL
jgi:dienelactone hydrolase